MFDRGTAVSLLIYLRYEELYVQIIKSLNGSSLNVVPPGSFSTECYQYTLDHMTSANLSCSFLKVRSHCTFLSCEQNS